MGHSTTLVTTIVAALALAFLLGTLAHRLRLSPLVGYLLAGVAVGPFTPGLVADQGLANELAEIGVILLEEGINLGLAHTEVVIGVAIHQVQRGSDGMGGLLAGTPERPEPGDIQVRVAGGDYRRDKR